VLVARRDIVSLCIAHDKLRSLNRPLVYTDRLCTRADARFSGDRDLLHQAAWGSIKRRDFRPDAANPGAVHRYDAGVLAWGTLPVGAVDAVVCKDVEVVDRFHRRCPEVGATVLARADLLW